MFYCNFENIFSIDLSEVLEKVVLASGSDTMRRKSCNRTPHLSGKGKNPALGDVKEIPVLNTLKGILICYMKKEQTSDFFPSSQLCLFSLM